MTAIVFTSYVILTGLPTLAHQVIPHVLGAEEGEGDGVLDEDSIVLGHAHQGACLTQRKLVNLNGTPGFDFADMDLGIRVWPGNQNTSDLCSLF